jgi:ketosteroid isomerase-like protein
MSIKEDSKDCPVNRYYESWNSGDLSLMEETLAPNVKFRGPMKKYDSAKTFMAGVKEMMTNTAFRNIKMVPKARVTEGNSVAVFYEFHTSEGMFPMAEHFRVSNGKISEIDCYFDPAPFQPKP